MITVAQAVETVIKVKPFLAEALSEGIVNISSVARKIQPQVEKIVQKPIKEGAIVMALNRMLPNSPIRCTPTWVPYSTNWATSLYAPTSLISPSGTATPFFNATQH